MGGPHRSVGPHRRKLTWARVPGAQHNPRLMWDEQGPVPPPLHWRLVFNTKAPMQRGKLPSRLLLSWQLAFSKKKGSRCGLQRERGPGR